MLQISAFGSRHSLVGSSTIVVHMYTSNIVSNDTRLAISKIIPIFNNIVETIQSQELTYIDHLYIFCDKCVQNIIYENSSPPDLFTLKIWVATEKL